MAAEDLVRIAVIGGSGFYNLDGFHTLETVNPETPWGLPSAPITIAASASGLKVAFLARHGTGHHLLPTEVPSRANIAALKHLGVEVILAFSAVGSLQEHIEPEDFVIPTQIIDRTKGIRPSTFFGGGLVAHAMFGEPFSTVLNDMLCADKFVNVLDNKRKLHTSKSTGADVTLVCMEGPQFSTRAESHMYRSFGGSVINMSALPESKLAREAEIEYCMICMSTDYDSWRVSEEPVTVEEVMRHVSNNTANAHRLAETLIEELEKRMAGGRRISDGLIGSMKYAGMTKPSDRPKEVVDKIEYILPGYYS